MKKCSALCHENNFDCEKKECRYWIDGISYARVKQIQDAALIKLKKRGLNLKQFLYD